MMIYFTGILLIVEEEKNLIPDPVPIGYLWWIRVLSYPSSHQINSDGLDTDPILSEPGSGSSPSQTESGSL